MLKRFMKVFKKKKKKFRLKQELTLLQEQDSLTLHGALSLEHYNVESLWAERRTEDKQQIKIAENTSEDKHLFHFQLSLRDLLSRLSTNLLHEEETFDWYLRVNVPTSRISEKNYEKLQEKADFFQKDGEEHASYFIRLGRFSQTRRSGLTFITHKDDKGLVYLTTKGNVSFVINGEPKTPTKIQIDRLRSFKEKMELTGKLFSRNSTITSSSFILRGRKSGTEYSHPFHLEWNPETEGKFGLNRYTYRILIDFRTLCNGDKLPEDVYDLYLLLTLHDYDEPKLVRIGRPAFRGRHLIKEASYQAGDTVSLINPYYTFKASNLSFEVFEYEKENYEFMVSKLRYAWFYRLIHRSKDVWIIGERPYKAQDTGYHFFKHVRETHPEKKAFYVIEEHSPERKNVDPLGNVIFFKSKEHIWYSLIARRVISSHHPDYLYPARTKRFQRAVHATKVFLQHGVMGTKNMIANYGKKAPAFDTDLFLVSSDFEKKMIVNDFGYKPEDVFVTGLSRFDSLLKGDVPVKDQLLIIPTWRDWISSDEVFLESEYYQRYAELIHNPDLHSFAKRNGMNIVFCLHPNMQNFTSHFSDAPVQIISQGEVDVQLLLKESKMMITDYSSVGFDFSFLDKPIIYYQFDRRRFIGKRPSHLDLDNDLPGNIVYTMDELLDTLNLYEAASFTMLPEYKERADKFIKYRDLDASKRIYTVIDENESHKTIREKVVESPIGVALFNRFRKSKHYFPTMKKYYSVARRLLPVDPHLILFESGVGKQYADSPRYLYEEIVRKGLPYKKVWVYTKTMPVIDESTIQIKRLSPQYFYYLAKARFWVNNQNFPTYIKKRKGTTYLQTWHGTPLKKMLFDIETVQGRSDDYLERVHGATKQWDYLVSPSDYASKAFRSAFKYDGDILEMGYPRNDVFFKDDKDDLIARVKGKLNLPRDKKILLYAPTFRDSETRGKNKFVFDIKMDLHDMQEKLGDEYIILLRMHVVISNKLRIPEELRSFVYNVSNYPEIQELSLISDMLITDYSSVMFDFANTGKPILFFTYDFEEYKNNIRGFYMDFEHEAPGPLVYDTDEIIQAILELDKVRVVYNAKYEAFRQKFCYLDDGNVSQRIVDKLF